MRTTLMSALLASTMLVASAQATTLSEAMSKAVATHPEIGASENDRDAIGHRIDEAKAGYKPTVDFVAGTGWENSHNISTAFRQGRAQGDKSGRDLWRNESRVTIRQMLFDGWQTKARVAQEENRFASADAHVMDVRNVVALRAVASYLDVLRTRELVALAEQNLGTHQSYVAKINNRTASGRSAGADVRQAEGRMELATANLEAAKGDAKAAEADYLEAVGEMPSSPSHDAAPFAAIPANTRAAVDRATSNSPVIASAMADIKAANAELAESKSVFCPRFELEGGASDNVNLDGIKGRNNDYTAMLMMRYNMYNGGHDVAQREERIEKVKGAVAMLEKNRRDVERITIKAYAQMETARARLNPLNSHVEDATSTRDAYAQQFDLGQRTLLDLLDSEVELYNSKSALITGKYEVEAAAYAVLAHMGDLVPAAGNQSQVAAK
jgi:adhesin transport system outer membrane protein